MKRLIYELSMRHPRLVRRLIRALTRLQLPAGYAVDTMETACDWPRVDAMVHALETAGRAALARHGERTHCYTHLSHVYAQGSSVYSTFVYRIGADYDGALARWQSLKAAVGEHEERHGELLVVGEPRHVRVVDDVSGMLVIAAVGDRDAYLVQPRRPPDALRGGVIGLA